MGAAWHRSRGSWSADAVGPEHPHHLQGVHRVPGEAGEGLGQDQVDFAPLPRDVYQLYKVAQALGCSIEDIMEPEPQEDGQPEAQDPGTSRRRGK